MFAHPEGKYLWLVVVLRCVVARERRLLHFHMDAANVVHVGGEHVERLLDPRFELVRVCYLVVLDKEHARELRFVIGTLAVLVHQMLQWVDGRRRRRTAREKQHPPRVDHHVMRLAVLEENTKDVHARCQAQQRRPPARRHFAQLKGQFLARVDRVHDVAHTKVAGARQGKPLARHVPGRQCKAHRLQNALAVADWVAADLIRAKGNETLNGLLPRRGYRPRLFDTLLDRAITSNDARHGTAAAMKLPYLR